jgi:hypothetical protein
MSDLTEDTHDPILAKAYAAVVETMNATDKFTSPDSAEMLKMALDNVGLTIIGVQRRKPSNFCAHGIRMDRACLGCSDAYNK